ncbi:MAG: amino acid ABC transporter permease [Propionibacteriaceae bacterium]|jgi:glutamate transport system permease protein|nr:amino acid ABC transporter permease [Propionibacteriaceae bacterium]
MDLTGYWEVLREYPVLHAFWVNITLTFWSGLLSLVLGTVAVAMRISPIASLRLAATFYVNVFRDIPLTIVMVAMYSVVWVSLGIEFSDTFTTNFYILAVIGLGLYHGSFVAEALRSGVNTVPLGQAEAARAIGLTFIQSARIIILPQAFRGAVAPLGNTLIALIKNTTVASATAVATETSGVMAAMIENRPDHVILIFLTFAIGYVIIVVPVGVLITHLSQRLAVKR